MVEEFTQFEKAGWNRIAGGYHRFLGPLTAQAAEVLLDAANVGPGTRVLDVATGPGYAAGAAAARGATVTGTDISSEILVLARHANPGVTYRVADAHDLPFDDGSFDVVVGGFIVPHLGDHATALGEFSRVLRPGGVVSLSTWDVADRVPILGAIVEAVAAAEARAPDDVPSGPPFFLYSEDGALAELLRSAGLEDVTTTSITVTYRVDSADAWWDGVLDGSVRTSALVRAQPTEVRNAIRRNFDRIAERYETPTGLHLPTSILIASGRRAGPSPAG